MFKTNPILYMSAVIQSMRSSLWGRGFVEFITPIIRRYNGCSYVPRLRLEQGGYLRESSALALRANLALTPRIFEISPCMRNDMVDKIHLTQFTMLDLYQQDANLSDAIDLCKELIDSFYVGPTKKLSVGKKIVKDLGVDLFTDLNSLDKLREKLIIRFKQPELTLTEMLNLYIEENVEPESKGCCLIVTEFPIVAEVLAKKKEGTVAIANNAEFQINGVEVANLYEDTADTIQLKRLAKLYSEHASKENEIICDFIDSGKITGKSAGFGIGIERLCQISLGLADIQDFIVSPEFAYKSGNVQ